MLTPRRRGPPRGALAVGCDVGGQGLKTVGIRDRRIVVRRALPSIAGLSAARSLREIEAALLAAGAALLGAGRPRGATPRGAAGRPRLTAGVALPGLLDRKRARPLLVANLPALQGVPLLSRLRRRTGWPIVLEPDSNAGAYGEALLGAGRGARRVLYLTLGTGVGAAMVIEGRIVRVANHTVGQVAHLPLEPGGPRCPCGARGCLESVLSARGIVWRARRAARRGAALEPAARLTPARLAEAARDGSGPARGVLAEVGGLLGEALAALGNLLSPDRIVVGGGISRAGDLLLAPARARFRKRAHPRLRREVTIRPALLTPVSGAAGAALLSLEGEE